MKLLSVSNAIHYMQKPVTPNYFYRTGVVFFGILAIIHFMVSSWTGN